MNDVRSTSPSARSSRSSGPTAPGRPRSSTCSPGSTSRRTGSICLRGARTSPAGGPDQITAAGRRADVPEHPPLLDDDRAGERHGRPARAHARRSVRVDHPAAAHAARGARGDGAGTRDCSTTWACARPSPTSSRSTSPTATSAGWRSRARWPPAPKLLLLDEPTAGMNPQESERADRLHAQAARRARAWRSCSSSTT